MNFANHLRTVRIISGKRGNFLLHCNCIRELRLIFSILYRIYPQIRSTFGIFLFLVLLYKRTQYNISIGLRVQFTSSPYNQCFSDTEWNIFQCMAKSYTCIVPILQPWIVYFMKVWKFYKKCTSIPIPSYYN